jgi:hypothetical protein
MTYRKAFPLLALVLVGGCNISDATDAVGPNGRSGMKPDAPAMSKSFPRSGELHVTKECTEFNRLAGGFCTITGSNIPQIEAGSKVIYTSASGPAILDSDVTLDPPGRGKSAAFGHVVLALVAGEGTVTFSGGTGKFKHFSGSVVVTRVGLPALKTWRWDGTYSFDPRD